MAKKHDAAGPLAALRDEYPEVRIQRGTEVIILTPDTTPAEYEAFLAQTATDRAADATRQAAQDATRQAETTEADALAPILAKLDAGQALTAAETRQALRPLLRDALKNRGRS